MLILEFKLVLELLLDVVELMRQGIDPLHFEPVVFSRLQRHLNYLRLVDELPLRDRADLRLPSTIVVVVLNELSCRVLGGVELRLWLSSYFDLLNLK